MQRLESNESGSITSAITGLHQIFTMVLMHQDIQLPRDNLPESVQSASEKFSTWLYARYTETHNRMLQLLGHKDQGVQELALCCIVKLLQSEGQHPIKTTPGTYPFPIERLEALVSALVMDSVDNQHLITLLFEYLECQDFMYYSLMAVNRIVKAHKGKDITEVYMNNLFLFLEQFSLPEGGSSTRLIQKLLLYPDSDEKVEDEESTCEKKTNAFTLPYEQASQCLEDIWEVVMKYPLTPDLHRRSLILLPDKVMPHLKQPVQLTGFFMESYNCGGGLSLLALQGVFVLINKHNLDYPDFYTKVYAMLEPTIFQARYRARFFMLLDRFLASSYLPEYIVASFTKRLSRLCLVAPTPCLILLIKFITNLLIRFPGLRKMIHNPHATSVERDPFDANESDMSKTHASESSLWELASLQQHTLPYVAKSASFINRNLPIMEYNIGEYVESTYEEIFERNCKLTVKENVPTTFHKPKGLFEYHCDQMSQDWSMV
ncbi:hypothetical protein Pmani_009486 [Petrolisthes manimaculis]|uniref:CCAAT-binding factor domain-containing protein n=1 Tax=Petrolisthes manimaculis TaxID=1843537 RepID=A0AAE1UGP2_9EUCA|nr:hypothetical protein Pmani_009486 [Petrolisthes manimaculis]